MSKESKINTYTIGFTQKKAIDFFGLIRNNNIDCVVDVRLNNISQLAGFAKRDDLKFFLRELCDADYVHVPDLAPTKPMLDAYKKKEIPWESYEYKFLDLMASRNIERAINQDLLDKGCLLCSEHKPHHCHRRLVVEYLNKAWGSKIEVVHLV